MAEIEETQKALEEIRSYDTKRIPRLVELGQSLNFENAVAPVEKVRGFFNRIPSEYVGDLSNNFRNTVYNQALAFLNILGQIQSFDPSKDENPTATRNNIITSLNGFYETVFNELHAAVAFIAARQRDFSSLELEARAAAEAATRQAENLTAAMQSNQQEANSILDAIRQVAAEQGVSQQATYFKEEADEHDKSASSWEKRTVLTAIGLGVYALLTLVLSFWLEPKTAYQAIQVSVSKILLFAVVAYMLFHCSRTLMAHRHNSIINRHRENALLTFNALVASAASEDKRDIVLTHAAACIFSPQETGYAKSAQGPQLSSANLIEALPRIAQSS